jgi:putative selenate reductase molybdopterin-binding subunit
MAYDEDGRMVNPVLGPYKIYRADEMPELDVILVQTNEPSGPFGAKAIAEIPKDGVAPALRSAILNATGVAMNADSLHALNGCGKRCRRPNKWPAL